MSRHRKSSSNNIATAQQTAAVAPQSYKYNTAESIPNLSQLQNYEGILGSNGAMAKGISGLGAYAGFDTGQVDWNSIAKNYGINDITPGSAGEQQLIEKLKGTAQGAGQQEAIKNQTQYGSTGIIPSASQLSALNSNKGTYNLADYRNVNGIIYNTKTRQAFDPAHPEGKMNDSDPDRMSANAFAHDLGLASGIPSGNQQFDINKLGLDKIQVDNNYNPQTGYSGNTMVLPYGTLTPGNSPISGQMGAIPPSTGVPSNPAQQPGPPQPANPLPEQIGALNGVGNSTSGNQNGVGNTNTGTQYTPGQTGAALGNISEQMTPQDQQRKAIGTDPNNITGYQSMNPIS